MIVQSDVFHPIFLRSVRSFFFRVILKNRIIAITVMYAGTICHRYPSSTNCKIVVINSKAIAKSLGISKKRGFHMNRFARMKISNTSTMSNNLKVYILPVNSFVVTTVLEVWFVHGRSLLSVKFSTEKAFLPINGDLLGNYLVFYKTI